MSFHVHDMLLDNVEQCTCIALQRRSQNGHSDRKEWGIPGINKDTLEEYWEDLLEKVKLNRKEEITFFITARLLKQKRTLTRAVL